MRYVEVLVDKVKCINLSTSCTVFVLTCTVVVLNCFVMCWCVGFVMRGCVCVGVYVWIL